MGEGRRKMGECVDGVNYKWRENESS